MTDKEGVRSGGFRDADWLRRQFTEALPIEAVHEDGSPPVTNLRPAAVLVPVVAREEALTVLLTRRTDHLHHHPGQISFPGGRAEEIDADAVHTALREAEEEVGLSPEHVEVIGSLPVYTTVTGFHVTPVVALVRPGFTLAIDSFEVAEAFEVPLAHFLDPARHQRHKAEYQGRMREYYAMPYGEHFIWGATAGILVSLYRFLGERK